LYIKHQEIETSPNLSRNSKSIEKNKVKRLSSFIENYNKLNSKLDKSLEEINSINTSLSHGYNSKTKVEINIDVDRIRIENLEFAKSFNMRNSIKHTSFKKFANIKDR